MYALDVPWEMKHCYRLLVVGKAQRPTGQMYMEPVRNVATQKTEILLNTPKAMALRAMQ
jgi:hypothetical protein